MTRYKRYERVLPRSFLHRLWRYANHLRVVISGTFLRTIIFLSRSHLPQANELELSVYVLQNFAPFWSFEKIHVIAHEHYRSRWKSSGKAILGVRRGATTSSTTRHYCRLMYVQSRPRWLGPEERASESWRNETKRTEGPHRRRAPVADRRDRDEPSSREVFSADRVAKPRSATVRVPLAE